VLPTAAKRLILTQRVGGSIPSRRTWSEAVSPVKDHYPTRGSNGTKSFAQITAVGVLPPGP
jgi:hypothetical protein